MSTAPSSSFRSRLASPVAAGALLLLATLLAYAPTLRATFIWNDLDYVTRPDLRSLAGLWRIWFDVGSTEQHYPLLHSFFWLQHRLWGDAPLGYHLVNLLLHAANAFLFTLVLRRLAVPGALAAGLLFAVHPVCVESVAWISEQKNTLSTCLFLAAALAYLRFDDARAPSPTAPLATSAPAILGRPTSSAPPPSVTPPSSASLPAAPRAYCLATVLFALALFAKSLTAVLPPALLVIAWWRRGRLDFRRDVVPLLPWFAVGAAWGLFSAWVEHTVVGASGADFTLTFAQRVLIAGRAIWFYFAHTLWPAGLVFFYPRWSPDPTALVQRLFPLAAAAATALLWLARRRARAPLAAWLLFLGLLFPVLGFFNLYAFRYAFVADHWQYLPLLPLLAFVTAVAATALARLPATLTRSSGLAAPLATAVLALLLGVRAHTQALAYHDPFTFFRTIVRDNPAAWAAHGHLGDLYFAAAHAPAGPAAALAAQHVPPALRDALLREDLSALALASYRETVRLRPDFAEGQNSLAAALFRAGHPDDALAHFRAALAARPDFPEALANLGFILLHLGHPADAEPILRRALALRPRHAETWNHLGSTLLALGRTDEALRAHREALRLSPDLVAARNNLANTLAAAGQLDAALAEFERALRLAPDDLELHLNYGSALDRAGRPADALPHYEFVLRAAPNLPEAHNNLGYALLRLSRPADAIPHFRRALALRPGYPAAAANLTLAEHALAP